ncbi:hypothetical protein [Streptosporangium roseum]|uniref:hypothetical protein n=1 Tax=Streptosporangium roseum TaxID=2001 RepID=UPI003325224B
MAAAAGVGRTAMVRAPSQASGRAKGSATRSTRLGFSADWTTKISGPQPFSKRKPRSSV